MSSAWNVRLGCQAEQDYAEITRWTATTFGIRQAEIYAEKISLAIQSLKDGPDVMRARSRSDIEPGIYTLHIARRDRKGRHFLVFRTSRSRDIDVLRLLHDSMDIVRHLAVADD